MKSWSVTVLTSVGVKENFYITMMFICCFVVSAGVFRKSACQSESHKFSSLGVTEVFIIIQDVCPSVHEQDAGLWPSCCSGGTNGETTCYCKFLMPVFAARCWGYMGNVAETWSACLFISPQEHFKSSTSDWMSCLRNRPLAQFWNARPGSFSVRVNIRCLRSHVNEAVDILYLSTASYISTGTALSFIKLVTQHHFSVMGFFFFSSCHVLLYTHIYRNPIY